MSAVRRFDDARAFSKVAEPFLMRDEARHNLELGVCGRLVGQGASAFGDELPYLAVAESGTEVVGLAMRTAPFNLLVSVRELAVLDAIAADVRDRFSSLPAMMSDVATAASFAERWCALTGDSAENGMPQRIYRLAAPPGVPEVPGAFREATRADRDLLIRWVGAFEAEAMPDAPHQDPAASVDGCLKEAARALFLWEDGEPVSMAGFGGSTPNGSRVGPVYTPPELRGRGYGSACVATLSRKLLAEGSRFLFLFTDRGNPASNHVYLKLGYEPVCDMQEIRFRPA